MVGVDSHGKGEQHGQRDAWHAGGGSEEEACVVEFSHEIDTQGGTDGTYGFAHPALFQQRRNKVPKAVVDADCWCGGMAVG